MKRGSWLEQKHQHRESEVSQGKRKSGDCAEMDQVGLQCLMQPVSKAYGVHTSPRSLTIIGSSVTTLAPRF